MSLTHAPLAKPNRVPSRCMLVVRSQCQKQDESLSRRKQLASLLPIALGSVVAAEQAQAAVQLPFLKGTGNRGFLAEQEENYVQLRIQKEQEAKELIMTERAQLEDIAREQRDDSTLCATPFGVDVVGITQLLGIIGASVGGILARQRKAEVETLNQKLRAINQALRQQARAGVVYAPGLSYAPIPASGVKQVQQSDVQVQEEDTESSVEEAPVPVATATKDRPQSLVSVDDETSLTKEEQECLTSLKKGKQLLKDKNGAAARVRFEKAVMLSKATKDKIAERRAVRGLAAASRLQKQSKVAIKYLERVLQISQEIEEFTGDSDAYGTIADIYTELGDLEKAAKYYDQYIDRLQSNELL